MIGCIVASRRFLQIDRSHHLTDISTLCYPAHYCRYPCVNWKSWQMRCCHLLRPLNTTVISRSCERLLRSWWIVNRLTGGPASQPFQVCGQLFFARTLLCAFPRLESYHTWLAVADKLTACSALPDQLIPVCQPESFHISSRVNIALHYYLLDRFVLSYYYARVTV